MNITELFKKYDINPDEHPNMIVTAAGNIYTNGRVDPSDRSDEIYPGGQVIDDKAIETQKVSKKK